ncbi:kinase-like domain-containing protein [Hyaloraphidium curvatum]|nr:kinase-like domain-containing protein [Hyaloraphidium curvatum]
MASASDMQSPRALYRPLRSLGSGGQGRVKLVADPAGTLRALKRYSSSEAARRECCALRKLGRFPGVVALIEDFELGNRHYVVLEYAAGGDLDHLLAAGPLPPDAARKATFSLLTTIAFMHGNGVAHRDLKPANVLLRVPGDLDSLCLADFGSSFTEDAPHLGVRRPSLKEMTTLAGTPLYLAPEILRGQPYGPPADLWALGCLVYSMLVGVPPFHSITEVLLGLERKMLWPAGVPEDARRFVLSLLEPDPELRATAVQGLLDPWILGPGRAGDDGGGYPVRLDEAGRLAVDVPEQADPVHRPIDCERDSGYVSS